MTKTVWNTNCELPSQALKIATHSVHQRLHREKHLTRLLQPDVNTSDLYTCLVGFSCFYVLLQNLCRNLSPEERSQIQPYLTAHQIWLSMDIVQFGDTIHDDIKHVVAKSEPYQFNSDDYDKLNHLGLLYVTEGSLMGGDTIAKTIRRNLQFIDAGNQPGGECTAASDLSLNHFVGYGKTLNQRHFSALKARIDHNGKMPLQLDSMKFSALYAFELLETIFGILGADSSPAA